MKRVARELLDEWARRKREDLLFKWLTGCIREKEIKVLRRKLIRKLRNKRRLRRWQRSTH